MRTTAARRSPMTRLSRTARTSASAAAAAAACLLACAPAHGVVLRDHGVYARVTGSGVVLGNSVVARRWDRAALRTAALVDRRLGGRTWSRGARDFSLEVGGARIG